MTRLVALVVILSNVAMAQSKIEKEKIRYAVIGDSYSCGEGASPKESWPAIMTQHLNAQGLHVDLVSNPSVTGWTTKDAIDRELPKFVNSNPTFASLLIGVNDWVQGVGETTFRNRFSYLLDQMLAVLPNKKRLLVVTIPDFGFDEAVGGGERRSALSVLPVRIGHLELRLLGEAAVREARLELLEVLDGLRPLLGRHGVFRFAVQALRRPSRGFVRLDR